MGGPWQISAGDVSETLRPAFFALFVLASAWVLSDARRRGGFRPWAVWAWALSTFLFPFVVLPLYFVARMFTRRAVSTIATSESVQPDSPEDEAGPAVEQSADVQSADVQSAPPVIVPHQWKFSLPLLYALALLLAGAVYFYQDYQSFDAHLARAARAKLYGRRERAIGEYRAALRTRDDAHTRKLLGLELLEAGRAEDALAELRAAAAGGEPDEKIHLHVAALLESLNRQDEAATSYKRFLDSRFCRSSTGDLNCLRARERLSTLTLPEVH